MSAITPAPSGLGGGLVHTFINPQPITKTSIARYNPRIVDPYRGKRAADPLFVVYGPKPRGGTAIGTMYEKQPRDPSRPRRRYLGKVGTGRGVFVNDPRTYRSLTKAEMNYEAILEKLGYDLYQELGRGIFQVPRSYLSRQRIIDEYTRTNRLALFLAGTVEDVAGQGLSVREATPVEQLVSNESLRIMCQMVEGYQDFENGRTQEEGREPESFIGYIERTHRPPEHLLTPDGRLVPIRGLIGLVAVARIIADTDVLGGAGGNAGFVWVKDETGQIIAAQAVKIDPGMAFQFERHGGVNWVDNTYRRLGVRTLTDIRDLQVANNNDLITLVWEGLTPAQKTEFLQVLYNSSRYLNSPEILDYLFYRDGRFTRSATQENPREIASRFRRQMETWLNIQLEIYQTELREFKERYQVQIACTEHIDQWGEFLIQQQRELVETAVEPIRLRLEETSRELTLSRLAQEAMRREIDQKEHRLQVSEGSLQTTRESLEMTRADFQSVSLEAGAMRLELGEKGRRLVETERTLRLTREGLEEIREERIREREESQRRLEGVKEECVRSVSVSRQEVGATLAALERARLELQEVKEESRRGLERAREESERTKQETQRLKEESDRRIVGVMRRLEVLEARGLGPSILIGGESSQGATGSPVGSLKASSLSVPATTMVSRSSSSGGASSSGAGAGDVSRRGGFSGGLFQRTATPPLTVGTSVSSSRPVSPVVRAACKPVQAFGAVDWAKYFGDVGVEPPLPPNIEEILATPCPFWPGKQLGETCLLVLIPAMVNGQPYTLDLLEQLIKNPKGGGRKAAYSYYSDYAKKQLGGRGIERPYWGLMTRDVVPGSRNKLIAGQEPLIAEKGRGVAGLRGALPKVLEAATSVLMEHVRTGKRLYPESPSLTFTRCEEVVNGDKMVIGNFSTAGLSVYDSVGGCGWESGVACFWKF